MVELSPARAFGFRLWHIRHAWTRRLEAALAPHGLTHLQFVLLRAVDWLVRAGERPTQARLAQAVVTDPMTVSKVLRLLERKGLIERPVHPNDPRARHLLPTQAGLAVLARAVPAAIEAQRAYFGALGPEGQEQLSRLLDRLLRLDNNPIACAMPNSEAA